MSSLKELEIENFNFNNVIYIECMFGKCSDILKYKIGRLYPNLKREAFNDEEDKIYSFI